jgi:hypothetical protein
LIQIKREFYYEEAINAEDKRKCQPATDCDLLRQHAIRGRIEELARSWVGIAEISFDLPANLDDFAAQLDTAMRQHNVYYDDLIKGAILEPLKIRTLQSDAFVQYMRSIGKLGGQNKVPRLSNDRVLADALSNYLAPLL